VQVFGLPDKITHSDLSFNRFEKVASNSAVPLPEVEPSRKNVPSRRAVPSKPESVSESVAVAAPNAWTDLSLGE
jgi:hypothetical protein